MSTFRGVVEEFPNIRIDFFRSVSSLHPPLACFLSHVHSDHLAGLEAMSFRGPFIYCSAATKQILLRLEKYPHRMNFARGFLEKSRVTYGHLDKLLKTIPVETPTRIALAPGNDIRVTLFDANHCSGAVMFLIENDKNAILYTGDVRSEPWFVNNLTRNPFLIGYTSGLKRLDCIYLDTSNIVDIPFPTKADGIKELLEKVSKYPEDTVFHFEAWTFGYEEVWMALSHMLKSQIHVDKYKLGIYNSLRGKAKDPKDPSDNTYLCGPFLSHEGPSLAGYQCGNVPQVGCLTLDAEARIHSCEKGIACPGLDAKTVWIRPIITRTERGDVAEVSVGGGGNDLKQPLELILEDEHDIDQFLGLLGNTEHAVVMDIKRMLREGLRSHQVSLYGLELGQGKLPLKEIVQLLARSVAEKGSDHEKPTGKVHFEALPQTITFPYSRHASYAELCHLIKVFNPRDVYPCTVDEENWDEEVSMSSLFGGVCSAIRYRHDDEMRELQSETQMQYTSQQTHTTASSDRSSQMLPPSSPVQRVAQSLEGEPVLSAKPVLEQNIPTQSRRNSHSQFQPSAADGNENEAIPLNIKEEVQKAVAEALPETNPTPPRDIIAISPGSASQSLRRKAIFDAIPEGFAKRVRRDYDEALSSPPPDSGPVPKTPSIFDPSSRKGHDTPEVIEISDGSDTPVPTPGSSSGNVPIDVVLGISDAESVSGGPTSGGEEDQSDTDPYLREWERGNEDLLDDTYIDHDDNIARCKNCGHEMWTVWMTQRGLCTGRCGNSPESDEQPYWELIDRDYGARPEIEQGLDAELRMDDLEDEYRNRQNIVGDYIDDHSDAYDSLDEPHEDRSEYDLEDDFIDDASIPDSETTEEDSSSDEEKDYEELYSGLARKHKRLMSFHESMMKDLLDSAYEYYDDSSDEDEDPASKVEEIDQSHAGPVMIHVEPPHPVVTDIVLSQAQGQSQESEVSAERIEDRAKAFAAAEGDDWGTISMVSTAENHTNAEIEL